MEIWALRSVSMAKIPGTAAFATPANMAKPSFFAIFAKVALMDDSEKTASFVSDVHTAN